MGSSDAAKRKAEEDAAKAAAAQAKAEADAKALAEAERKRLEEGINRAKEVSVFVDDIDTMFELGREGEDIALAFFLARGFALVCRNWHCRYGELDLVLEDRGTIAFAEVKARGTRAFGSPADGIDASKLRKLSRAALAFLAASGLGESRPCRFDVFSVSARRERLHVEWTKGAFDAADTG